MVLISTVIYFGDDPAGYYLSKEKEEFIFTPCEHKHCSIHKPIITAKLENDQWVIKETNDLEVKDQVVKLLNLNALVNFHSALSVAS
ncbi:MAG: hypothetical protein NVS1B13_21450 [Flavisolibacter sp.]